MAIKWKSKFFWIVNILVLSLASLAIILPITLINKSKQEADDKVKKISIVNKDYDRNVLYLERLANSLQNKSYFVSSQNKQLNTATKKEIFKIMRLKDRNVYFSNKIIKIVSDEKTRIERDYVKVNLEISQNNITKSIKINVKRIPSFEESNDLKEQDIHKKIYTISSNLKYFDINALSELKKIIEKDIKGLYPNKLLGLDVRNNLKVPWKNPIIYKLNLSPNVPIGTPYSIKEVEEPGILVRRLPTLMEANNILEQERGISSNEKIIYNLLEDKKSEFISSFNLRLGNKYFSEKENTLNDWGLRFKQVFPSKDPTSEKALDVSIKYISYDFNNKKVNARLIWKENGSYKAKNILVKGFLDPKIKVDNEHEIYEEEFKDLVLPNSFKIPETVKKIHPTAFKWTVLPRTWEHPKVWKDEIPESAYYGTTIPENFVIPKTVKKISSRAFQKSKGYLPKNIPTSVTKIEFNAFRNAEGKLPLIPDSVKEIGRSAFTGHILPDNWVNPAAWKTIIPKYAYWEVTFPNSFKMPDTVIKLESASFGYAKLSNNFQLSKNLKEIGSYAFMRGDGKILKIPSSISIISKTAFFEFKDIIPNIPKSIIRTP